MQTSKRFNPVSAALTFTLALVIWSLFAPVQAGGQTSYVIIDGDSMEPNFFQGDLALIRRAPYYHLGEVVAYEMPEFGYVFHRIVARELDGFVLQGDNNYWLDSYHPTEEEILGRFWFHIPQGGTWMQQLRQPGIFTMLVMGFFILAVLPEGGEKDEKNPHHPKARRKKR